MFEKLILNPEIIWLFDYDLTIYPHSERHILDRLDVNITRFVQNTLQCDHEEANNIRVSYHDRYGTTLNGMIANYQTDPNEYFDYIHNQDNILPPERNPVLEKLLKQIQGPKYIFTNGRKDWCLKGIEHMQIAKCFVDIFDIQYFNWQNKPAPSIYSELQKTLLEKHGKSQFIFLDDKKVNLLPAQQLGWHTIWISPSKDTNTFDYRFETINQLCQQIKL